MLPRSTFVTALAAILITAPLHSQSSSSNPGNSTNPIEQTPTIKTTARAVVVDVVVTKGDDAVTGLSKTDFEVLEDGKPQTIDFFEEHTAKQLPAGSLAALPKMPPNVYTNVPPAPESDAVNVLLLDSLNTERQDQINVHHQIIDFLHAMPPGTRTAIFTLGSKLRYIQGFTTDSSLLIAAIDDKKNGFQASRDSSTHSRSDATDDANEIKQRMTDLGGHSDAGVDALIQSQADFSTFAYGNRMSMTLEALDYLARYLGAVPGRKNLIWFASDFPVFVFPNLSERQAIADTRGDLNQVRRTADLMTVSKVAVYPINAEGMLDNHMMDATNSSVASMGEYTQSNSAHADTISTMEQLAGDTGGKAFYNTNDFAHAIQRAIADGSHYYTIVYSPTNKKMDGNYRNIQVKVTQGRYKLSYRRGYNADSTTEGKPAQPEGDPLRHLLMRGLPGTTQVLYGARVLPASPQPAANATRAGKNPKLAGPVTRYTIDLMIRKTDVTLAPEHDGSYSGKIQLGMIVYSSDGTAVNWNGATQQMSLKPDAYAMIQKTGVPAHMEIDVPNQDVWLEIGVYDWASNKAGTLEVPLHPAAVAAAQAAGAAPSAN